jgi:hypothetical protein
MRRFGRASVHGSAWTTVLVCAFATYPGIAGAQQRDSQTSSEQPLQEVTVTAERLHDHRELVRAVSGFVDSHSAPEASRTSQIGRWYENVCPLVTGLQPAARDFITREILKVARTVGAPTGSVSKKCVTVEIVFTREPQALLDHVARSYRALLGFNPASQTQKQWWKSMTTFSRPIQAWYETGTRPTDYQPPQANGPICFTCVGATLDSDATATPPTGTASRFRQDLRSEFVHVLIIADGEQIARYSLQSVADYLAVLSLTHVSQLTQCAPLPSITDLLAIGCAAPVADALTAADRAYLKALYSADLQKNINIERDDIHDQMMRQIAAQ